VATYVVHGSTSNRKAPESRRSKTRKAETRKVCRFAKKKGTDEGKQKPI